MPYALGHHTCAKNAQMSNNAGTLKPYRTFHSTSVRCGHSGLALLYLPNDFFPSGWHETQNNRTCLVMSNLSRADANIIAL